MAMIEVLAQAALQGDGLTVRSLAQDLLHDARPLVDVVPPVSDDPRVLVVAAALLELLADRSRQAAPAWTARVGRAPEPIYLLEAARTMKRLRVLCELEAPEALRKRGLYAPPNYLTFA